MKNHVKNMLTSQSSTHTFVYWWMHSLAPVWVPSVRNGFLVAQRDASVPHLLLSTFRRRRRRKVRSVKVWLETKPQPADYFILGTGPQRPPCIFICRSAPPHTDPPLLVHASPAFLLPVYLSLSQSFALLAPHSIFFPPCLFLCLLFFFFLHVWCLVVSFSQLYNVWLQHQTPIHIRLVKRLGFRPVLFPGWLCV